MICLDVKVRQALIDNQDLALLVGECIWQVGEPVTNTNYPRIGFEEVSNVPSAHADDSEIMTAITYRFLVYANEDSVLNKILSIVENVFKRMGFMRRDLGKLYSLPDGIVGKELLMIINLEDDING